MHSAVSPNPVDAMLAMRRGSRAPPRSFRARSSTWPVFGLACSQKYRQPCRSRSSRKASSSLESFHASLAKAMPSGTRAHPAAPPIAISICRRLIILVELRLVIYSCPPLSGMESLVKSSQLHGIYRLLIAHESTPHKPRTYILRHQH